MTFKEARLAGYADPNMQMIEDFAIIRLSDDTFDYLPLGQPVPQGATIAGRYRWYPNSQEWVMVE